MNGSRKSAGAGPAGGISLFPFLAVLICVMGGLIVLLVVLARHARVQATRIAQTTTHQKKIAAQEIQQQREMLQWQAEQIQESRAKTEAQLTEARLQLSGAEDHLRQLRQELEQLQRAWQALEQSVGQSADLAQMEDRLRQLQAEILRTQQQLTQKQNTEQKPQIFYAIVPYQGPYGTTRRPIYIECRQESVIIQPEGIVLTPRDFEGPLTQDSPLARAVRAVREYWANRAGGLPEGQEPYPLLLVRPDGIVAYYAAREALQEWGSEFGYELIGQDWKLKFPPPDAQLAQLLREEVQLARARQELLAKIAPRVAHRAKPRYRVGPQGIQLEDSGTEEGATRPGVPRFAEANRSDKTRPHPTWPADQPEDLHSAHPTGSGSGGPGRGAHGTLPAEASFALGGKEKGLPEEDRLPVGSAQAGGSGPGHPFRPGPGNSPGISGGGPEAGLDQGALAQGAPPGGGSAAFGSEHPLSGSSPPIGAGAPSGGWTPSSMSGGTWNASGGPSAAGSVGPTASSLPSLPDQAQAGGGFSAARQWVGGLPEAIGGRTPSEQGSLSGQAGRRLRPGEWYDPPPRSPAQPDMPSDTLAHTDPKDHKKSSVSSKELRNLRGRNWALPNATDKAIPITRPIPLQCYPDRWVVGAEGAGRKEIPLGPRTAESLDELVGAIWEQIDRWGIAGRGMYWRPVLSVQVAPGAEDRFQELQTLLEESGILIERRR